MISQSNFIAGAIVIGFLFYITARHELSGYIAVFTGKGASTPAAVVSTTSASSSQPANNSIANAANTGTISSTPTSGGQQVIELFGSDQPTDQQIQDYINGK
jgi:hypothetical protein